MKNIEWVIVTPETANAVFAELKSKNQPIAMFAITGKGYENLSLNISDIMKLVQQQRAIIIAYEEYYKQVNSAIDNTNKSLVKDKEAISPEDEKTSKKWWQIFKQE